MSENIVKDKEEPPICRDPVFAMVLSHATKMAAHILDEAGDDQETLESSHVTLSCDFVLDTFDLLLEYALRYEGDVFGEVHDQLLEQYKLIASRKAGFGSRTIH